ncbi:uncharacterized protein SCODWIG_00064 [Saccharomycodes ludwigii]|uniref:Zinc transporter n=1 Tax=Saccharomycodes ludwigii TaxID=36035 RepID=A0A376B0X1_9ASCO|nr:uncharacterized protein SCODWIG_00064 [Saccharomycodes ludwigii]
MLFVYFGSLFILILGSQDLASYFFQGSSTNASQTIEDSNVTSNYTVNKYKACYITFAVGFMAMNLQFLSFKSISKTFYGDILVFVFILYSSYISQFFDLNWKKSVSSKNSNNNNNNNKDANGYNISGATNDTSCNKDEHESLYDENKNMFLQLARTPKTRSIFSFLLLNTSFMFVQMLYSFRSKSLGLLSDSLHMALDCTSLFLGLCAGVLSKKPPNQQYPLGFRYLETLAGFTNGVLLVGIVSAILVEAVERIFNRPVDIRDTNELLIVSILGLFVNLVGLVAFDHHHGSGDNMRGIFLHILADTLGSVGVVFSTILTKIFKLSIFDPIASIMIALLILVSSIPLLKSTTSVLLLKLDDKNHNLVKEALNTIQTTPGICGYTTPRFWENTIEQQSAHTHSHDHSHNECHEDEHKHETDFVNSHAHEHSHEETHEHSHGETHEHSHEETHEHSHEETHEHSHEETHEHSHQHCPDNSIEHKDFGAHNCSHEASQTSTKMENDAKLCGYIHIQCLENENTTIIRKRVEKIFEECKIAAYIQVEKQSSPCWCRKN